MSLDAGAPASYLVGTLRAIDPDPWLAEAAR